MLFSNKDLMRIILPLFVEQLLVVTIGMLDSMMVSSVGEAAVSGVSLVDTLNLLLNYIFTALATGGVVVCSQFLGRRELRNARASAKQLIYSITFTATIISAVVLVFRKPLLGLVFGSVGSEVMGHAQIYFLFTALSYPFYALYSGGAALFRAMGNSKISMIASVTMNILNFLGNALLIYVFHLGVAGAAISTLFSRIVGSVLVTALLHNKRNPVFIEKLFSFRPDFKIIKSILGIGIPSGLENGMFQFGKLLTQSLVSTMGTAVIAANAVANTVASFQYAVGGAVGISLVTIVGRCMGAGEKEQAKRYARRLLVIDYIALILMAVAVFVLGKPIISLYNISGQSARLALELILVHIIFNITIWPFSFSLPHAFRAASDVRFTMYVSVISMWVFRVGFCYVLAGYFKMGIHGVWLAMYADWIFRGTIFGVRFFSGRWLTKYKPPEASQNA